MGKNEEEKKSQEILDQTCGNGHRWAWWNGVEQQRVHVYVDNRNFGSHDLRMEHKADVSFNWRCESSLVTTCDIDIC